MMQQYDGFTPGERVFGRTPKMHIGAADSPIFCDFTNPNDSPVTKTHQLLAKLREIRKASLRIDYRGKVNGALNQRVRDMRIEGFFVTATCLFLSKWRK